MKLAFVIGNISRLAGGVSEALIGLSSALARLGVEQVILTRHDRHFDEDRHRFGGIEVVAHSTIGPTRYPVVRGLRRTLQRVAPDVLHLHGMWSYESVAVRQYAADVKTPYVVSPHGMLDPWILAKSRHLKQVLFALNEGALLRGAGLIHALSPSEARSIAALSLATPTVELPNGVDLTGAHAEVASTKERLAERPRRFVYLGRIDPKKNLHGLIAGWRLFRDRVAPDACLEIAGWGPDAYRDELLTGLDGDPAAHAVKLVGPRYGVEKAAFLRNAHFLALPSFSEGFPMVPLEAWAQGTAPILSEYCNMDFAFAEGLALRCGTTPDEIAEVLAQAYRLPAAHRRAQGLRGYEKVASSFAWPSVAERWVEHYRALMDGQNGTA